METIYSIYYRGTKAEMAAEGEKARKLGVRFLHPSIAKSCRAYVVTLDEEPARSLLWVEFFTGSADPVRIAILNTSRMLTASEEKNEVAQMRHRYARFIDGYWPGSAPKALYVPRAMTQEAVSRYLRGSGTLEFKACETYETKDVTLHASERGFAMHYGSEMDRSDRYYRLLILQALMLAYAQRMGQMTAEMTKILDRGMAHGEVLALRERMALFNARHYFHYPVDPAYHELYGFHTLMVRKMNIQQTNKELDANMKALEEISRVEHDRREARFHKWMAVLGIVVGIASISGIGRLLGLGE